MSTLTPGELRALKAVKHGDVRRIYDAKGNRFTVHENAATPHPSGAVLWRLERRGMLKTDPGSGGVMQSVCSVELSSRGEAALTTGERRDG